MLRRPGQSALTHLGLDLPLSYPLRAFASFSLLPSLSLLIIITFIIYSSKAAHATSLGSHCSVNSAQPSALPNGDGRAAATAAVSATAATASAHPQSTKRQVTFEISTAEVDPDYLMSFKTRTISVPEFEEFIRQHRGHNKPIDAADTKVVRL